MSNGQNITSDLRFTFVGMLFALVVAEVALQAADLITRGPSFVEALPAYAHLLVALAVIATSWVGWSASRAAGNLMSLQKVFSLPFLVLLVDALIVIAYFVIVKSVDIKRPSDGQLEVVPTAMGETSGIMAVFCLYVVWDLLTETVVVAPGTGTSSRFWSRLTRCWMSFVSAALAALLWCLVGGVSKRWSVISVDGALLSLAFFFRALKEELKVWAIILFITLLAFSGLGWLGR